MNILNLKGEKYEHFEVVEQLPSKKGRTYWKCKCECGNYFEASSQVIRSGYKQSCGCIRRKNLATSISKLENMGDLTGKRFGYLEVLHLSTKSTREAGQRIWTCKCHNCGKEIDMIQCSLQRNRSCGCVRKKIASRIIKSNMGIVEGTNASRIAKDTIGKNNTSGIRGVNYHKKTGKWNAYIGFKRKLYNLGYYETIEEAAQARRIAEEKLFGDFLEWYNNEYKKK